MIIINTKISKKLKVNKPLLNFDNKTPMKFNNILDAKNFLTKNNINYHNLFDFDYV